jgi:hypothetical protein
LTNQRAQILILILHQIDGGREEDALASFLTLEDLSKEKEKSQVSLKGIYCGAHCAALE